MSPETHEVLVLGRNLLGYTSLDKLLIGEFLDVLKHRILMQYGQVSDALYEVMLNKEAEEEPDNIRFDPDEDAIEYSSKDYRDEEGPCRFDPVEQTSGHPASED